MPAEWIGPAVGAAAMGLGALSSGLGASLQKPGQYRNVPTKTGPQSQAMDWATQTGMQQIQNPMASLGPMADSLTNRWNQQVAPSIAARFAGMGEARPTSGAFTQQLQQSHNQLGDIMAQYALQQQGLGQSLMGQGLQDQFQPVWHGPEDTFWSRLLGGTGEALGQFGGQMLGGGMNFGGGGQGGGGAQGGGLEQKLRNLSPDKKRQIMPILQQLKMILGGQ